MTSNASTPVHAETATLERARRVASETKAAYKTTEFIVYIAAVVAVLIASNMVGQHENQHDYFPADRAWLYVTLLTIGYMISRGPAKAGRPHRRRRLTPSLPAAGDRRSRRWAGHHPN